jgi:hypothetical protein
MKHKTQTKARTCERLIPVNHIGSSKHTFQNMPKGKTGGDLSNEDANAIFSFHVTAESCQPKTLFKLDKIRSDGKTSSWGIIKKIRPALALSLTILAARSHDKKTTHIQFQWWLKNILKVDWSFKCSDRAIRDLRCMMQSLLPFKGKKAPRGYESLQTVIDKFQVDDDDQKLEVSSLASKPTKSKVQTPLEDKDEEQDDASDDDKEGDSASDVDIDKLEHDMFVERKTVLVVPPPAAQPEGQITHQRFQDCHPAFHKFRSIPASAWSQRDPVTGPLKSEVGGAPPAASTAISEPPSTRSTPVKLDAAMLAALAFPKTVAAGVAPMPCQFADAERNSFLPLTSPQRKKNGFKGRARFPRPQNEREEEEG